MGIDLQGIARLVGVGDSGASGVAAPTGAAGFVTTVKRAGEIAPFETVIRKAAAEQAQAAPRLETAPGAEDFKAKNANKARKSFEAFALQVFIGSMLPKENAQLFGTGSAGKLWQSLLAEKLADQIASSGRLKLLPDEATLAAAPKAPPEGRKTEPSGEAR
jgi:peptidoglycan hydrolase FlgJ